MGSATNFRNGIIRGYKLFVQRQGGEEMTINIEGNDTDSYTLTGLLPTTAYIISALAYTVGDGPGVFTLLPSQHPQVNTFSTVILSDVYEFKNRINFLYPHTANQYTVQRLVFGASYLFTIRVEVRFSVCSKLFRSTYLNGEYVDSLNATTKETGNS